MEKGILQGSIRQTRSLCCTSLRRVAPGNLKNSCTMYPVQAWFSTTNADARNEDNSVSLHLSDEHGHATVLELNDTAAPEFLRLGQIQLIQYSGLCNAEERKATWENLRRQSEAEEEEYRLPPQPLHPKPKHARARLHHRQR